LKNHAFSFENVLVVIFHPLVPFFEVRGGGDVCNFLPQSGKEIAIKMVKFYLFYLHHAHEMLTVSDFPYLPLQPIGNARENISRSSPCSSSLMARLLLL